MLIIIFLLSALSIPKVWLKPAVVDSDFDSFYDEDARSKRPGLLFDIIQQAIDNHANCANKHLAPLKALANSKQYETFVSPDRNYPSSHPTLVGATNSNRNKPNIKCRKVNLCSVQNQHSHSIPSYNSNEPLIVGKTHDSRDYISKEHRQYFPYNTKGFVRLPKYDNSRYGLRNKPRNYNPEYSPQVLGKPSFTYFPSNREIFNRLVKRPNTFNKNMVEITAIQNARDPVPILGSGQRNTNPSSQIKSCICSEAITSKAITSENLNSDFSSRMETTTEKIILETTKSETPKSCGCLKVKTPKPENTESSESDNATEKPVEIKTEPESPLT